MRIIIISNSVFPFGSAYSLRLQSLSQLLVACGHSVHIIADYTFEAFSSSEEIKCYNNLTYQTISGKPSSVDRVKNTFRARTVYKKIFRKEAFDFVIVGNTYDKFGLIRHLCKEKGVPLVLEICEWYDTNTFRFKTINPYTYLYKSCINYRYLKASGAIVISRLLESHFSKHNVPTIRIPVILDTVAYSDRIKNQKKPIKFIHVGFSGKYKEKFETILIALSKFVGLFDFEYHIYGLDYDDVLKNIDSKIELLTSLDGHLFIEGRIPQENIHTVYSDAWFSIFIRPNKKSSDAGFPTKLVESMSMGVPVIANDTGDIGLYLNNENGFVVKDDTVNSLIDIFKRIFTMTESDIKRYQKNALSTASRYFDYRCYTKDMKGFLDNYKK